MEQLDQLHVVSDLHFGGEPGHQIFDQGELLAALVDHLRDRPRHLRVGLVLCGDIVDFLAVKDARYLDAEGAVQKLEGIMRDAAFSPVFAALGRFVRAENRTLALVLGNHDVELALPHVLARLLDEICGGDAEARGRVRVAMDGTGYACSVGGRSALCVHGNEVDPWNVVPPAELQGVITALEQGGAPPAWRPNAGTRLVIDIMNKVKMRFPLVDLLKPETVPVLGVLLALDPTQLGALKRFAPVAARLSYDKARFAAGFLSGDGATIDEGKALEELLGHPLPAPTEAKADAALGDWLSGAKQAFVAGEAAGAGREDRQLGWMGMAMAKVRGQSPHESLRDALSKWLKGDKTFAIDTEDETFRRLDDVTDPSVHYLVAGHTHLSRALGRRRGAGFYFNSGTWIRLIRLTEAMLGDEAAFEQVFKAFAAGTMAALDEAKGLILREPTVVSIEAGEETIEASLRRVELGSTGQVRLSSIEGSMFKSQRIA